MLTVQPHLSSRYVTTFGSALLACLFMSGGARAQSVKSVVLTPATVVGGTGSVATITLTKPAGTGGLTISLTSDQRCATIQGSVKVPSASVSAEVKVATTPVNSNTKATLTAIGGGTHASALLTVQSPQLKSLALNPATVVSGAVSVGTVTLTGPAPTGGLTVSLTGIGNIATVPASVKVAATSTTGAFQIKTKNNQTGTEIIAANLNGKAFSANLVVTGPSGLAASAWPKFKGNVLNTGLSNAASAMGKKQWVLKNPTNANFGAPVLAADGTLYLSADDGIFYAITPKGTIKWSLDVGAPMGGVPAVGADGTIYVGANDNRLHAIRPDGTEKWSFLTGLNILSSPTVGTDGTIYFGSADGYFYALHPNGTQKWAFKAQANIYSSPALAPDGTIYFGSEDRNVYALNSLNGALKWSYQTGHVIRNGPAIAADGTIYVGSWDTFVYAISPTGKEKWAFKTGSASIAFASPAIGKDGTIYVGSWNATFYALNPNGSKKWAFTMPTGTGNSPAITADGTIYVPCDNGSLYALTPTGAQKWVIATSNGASCPAIGADGTVYVSLNGSLYAIR